MSHYLYELVQVLSERKTQAYAQQSAGRIALIETRLEKLRSRYQFKAVTKACVSLWRTGNQGIEVLAFKHPLAGSQLVKGTHEAGEDILETARRELHEESGLIFDQLAPSIGNIHYLLPGDDDQAEPLELQTWHLFLEPAPAGTPSHWSHQATGSPEENGLIFEFFWQPLSAASDNLDFAPIFQLAIQNFAQSLDPQTDQTRTLEPLV